MVDAQGGVAYQQQINYGQQPVVLNQSPVGLNQTIAIPGGGIAPAPQLPPGLPPNAS